MRNRSLLLITMLLVALLPVLAVPAHAGPPTEVGGLWQYKPTILNVKIAGGNQFLETIEEGIWTGGFDGDSTEDGQVVIHSSGLWSYNGIVSFEGTVDGKLGTLEMSVGGTRPDGFSDWEGRWVILSGTDELANLRGQGTWWGPGAPAPGEWGDIYYEGTIHFEPE